MDRSVLSTALWRYPVRADWGVGTGKWLRVGERNDRTNQRSGELNDRMHRLSLRGSRRGGRGVSAMTMSKAPAAGLNPTPSIAFDTRLLLDLALHLTRPAS